MIVMMIKVTGLKEHKWMEVVNQRKLREEKLLITKIR